MLAALASKAVGFLMIPLYTHYLSTADYGRLELLDLTATLISMLAGMGIGTAAMRYYYDSDDPVRSRTAISTAFIGGMLFMGSGALLLCLCSRPIASILLEDSRLYRLVLIQAAGLFLDGSCSIAQSYMRIGGRSGLLVTVSMLRLVVGLTLNILFVAGLRLGVAGVLLGGFAGALVAFTIQSAWLVRQVRMCFDRELFWKLWRYGAPLVPSAFATFVVAYADRFLLRAFGELGDVGVYSLAYKFGFLVQFLFVANFHMVWDPRVFDVAKRPNAQEVFARILTYWFAGLCWGGLALSVGAHAVIPHISPQPYWSARTYVWLIAAAYVLNGVRTYCTLGLLVTDRTSVVGKAMGLLSVVWIGAYALLIWKMKALGGAIGTLLSYGGTCVILVGLALRAYPMPIEWRRLLAVACSAGLVYVVAVRVDVDHAVFGVALKALFVLAYPLLLVASGFLRQEERAMLRAWLGRFRRGVSPPSSV